jgi:hypothetical protein
MKFHEVKMVGKLWIHRVPTLLEWRSEDIARLVFVEDQNSVFYGGTEEYGDWINVSEYHLDEGTAIDPISGISFNGRDYLMKVVNGNIRLQY